MSVRCVGSQCLATSPTSLLIGASSASLSLWVRLNPGCHVANPGGTQLFGDGAGRLSVLLDPSGELHASWNPNGIGAGGGSSATLTPLVGVGHHLAMTWQDGLQQYFLDGTLIQTTNVAGSLGSTGNPVPLLLGSDSTGTDVTIDEPTVWAGYVLTPTDAANLAARTVHPAGVTSSAIVVRYSLAGPDGVAAKPGDPGLMDASVSGLHLAAIRGTAPTYQAGDLAETLPFPLGSIQVAPSGTAIVVNAVDLNGQPAVIESLLSIDDIQALVMNGEPAGGHFTLALGGQQTAPIPVTATPASSLTWTFTGLQAGTNYVARVYYYPNAYYGVAHFDFFDPTGAAVGQGDVDQTKLVATYQAGPAFNYNQFTDITTLVPTASSVTIRLTAPMGNLVEGSMIQLTPAGGPASGDPNESPQTIKTLAAATIVGPWSTSGSARGTGVLPTYGIDPAALQTALLGLSGIPAGSVAVSNPSQNVYLIHFMGPLANTPQPTLVASDPGVQVVHDGTSGSVVGGQCPSISINGGPAITLREVAWGAGTPTHVFPFALYPLPRSEPASRVIGWREGIFSAGGYWSVNLASDGTVYGSLGDLSATPETDGSASWTLQGLPPDTYQVAVSWPADASASPKATYTVSDGTNTLGSVTVDQTKAPADFQDGGHGWKVVGSFSPAATVNQLVVTVSGTGVQGATLRGGPIHLARTSPDRTITVRPTDSVTFSAPAQFIRTATCSAPAIAAVPVANLAGKSFLPPFTVAPKAMKYGWNLDYSSYYAPSSYYTNLVYRVGAPDCVATQDADNYPLTIKQPVVTFLAVLAVDDPSGDGWGIPVVPQGRYTLEWDGASNCTLGSFETTTVVTEDTSKAVITSGANNHREFLITDPLFRGPGFLMRIGSTAPLPGGTFAVDCRNIRIYPPDPADPSGATAWVNPPRFHPGLIAQLAGCSCIRAMTAMGIVNSNVRQYSDLPTPTQINKYNGTSRTVIPLKSIGPQVGTDPYPAGIPNRTQMLVTTAIPHGLDNGMVASLWPANGSTLGLVQLTGDPAPCRGIDMASAAVRVLSPTTFLVSMWPAGGMINTLTPTGATVAYTAGDGGGVAYEDLIALCSEVGADAWINVPLLASDACVTEMATFAAQKLKPNLKVHVELSNEVWNGDFLEYQAAAGLGNLQHAADPTFPDPSVGTEPQAPYYVYRLCQVHDLFRAAFVAAGRPATDVRRVMGVQAGYNGALDACLAALQAIHPTDYTTRIDEVAPAFYWSNDPADVYGRSPSLQTTYDLLSKDQLLDLFEQTALHGNFALFVNSIRAPLDAAGLTGTDIVTYEGGPTDMMPNASPLSANHLAMNHTVARHPRFFAIVLRMLQNFNDAGCKLFMDFFLSGNTVYAEWAAFLYTGMPPGTGDPTLDAMNLTDPMNVGAIKSQAGGAARLWSSPGVVAPITHKRLPPGRNGVVRAIGLSRGMLRPTR